MGRIYKKTKIILITLMTVLSGVLSAQVTITLGAGTTASSGTTAGPINEYYRSLHCQIVYTAAELNAAGVCSGTINKLGFYINTGVTNPLPNYTIKMKGTSATNVATYDGTGLTTVYNAATYSPLAGGFDLLTLNTPFVWNGVDNILIDVCFDQVSAYTSTGTVRIYSPTVPNGFIYVRNDSAPQCGVACATTANTKPQIQFEFASPSPVDLGVASVLNPGSKKCFGNDTIVVKIKNHGTSPIDFAITPAVVNVQSTGANVNTYSLSITSGSLGLCSSQDYTMTTAYNMSIVGNYYLKAFTTIAGDVTAFNDTVNVTKTRTPYFTTSILPNDSVCRSVPVQLNSNYNNPGTQVGTGTIVNGGSSYPTPYAHYYGGARHQFLYLASELTAAGILAGNIDGIKFNITNLNSVVPLLGYNVAIATTTLTALTTIETTGFTTYFSTTSYTPVLGANTHTFSTPFVWDGISNIIVENCFNNNDVGPGGGNASVSQSSTPFTSSIWFRADNNAAVCTTTTSTGTMSQRPNTWFLQPVTVTYTWSPALGLSSTSIPNPIATLTASQDYTVTADLNAGCISNDIIRSHIKPTPQPSLGIDTLLCDVPYVLNANTVSDSYLWNNGATTSTLSISNPGKYWLTASNTNSCVVADTINILVGATPIVTLGQDTAFCQGKSITLYAGNPGCTYLWNTGATTSTIAVNTVGTYSVVVTNTSTCNSSDIVNVTVKSNPTASLVFTGQTIFCPTVSGRILNEGTPSGGNYIGAGVSGTSPNQMFNANQAGQGTYVILYNYTAPNGCNNIAKDTLFVQACVGVDELTNDVSLNVYPNPNTGLFTMEINANSDIDAKIYVMSIDSRLVYEDVLNGNGLITKTIDISPLANGIYYLRLSTKDVVKTFKLMKQ